ncbi:hypothetical protein [Acinetobacter sp. WZC-1]|uniref:hypothetical protein n=1 Tax=Acinetobacter sp. WZC-1 TaxID=3459034 RepID=UPI00403D6475
MTKIIVLVMLTVTVLLGYVAYIDSEKKKHREMLKIIEDANQSIHEAENNPHNYSKHLTSWNRQM